MKEASDEKRHPVGIGTHPLLSTEPDVYCHRMAIQLMPVTNKHKHMHLFRTCESFLSKSYS